jgi:hypothetical protein
MKTATPMLQIHRIVNSPIEAPGVFTEMSENRLTPKQEKFVENYLSNGGNGTRAAGDAGYSGTPDTLKQVASENLAKP